MIDKIVETTKIEVARRREQLSLEELQSITAETHRNLIAALGMHRNTVILECKKSSPSKGLIRPNFDIRQIVKSYHPFADAISVLTNQTFFEGSLKYLTMAREMTDKVLLCKDFILSPYQVYEARFYGADAVLLMMSLLDDENAHQCFDVAKSLKMDALVEVHDEEELQRALALGASIIGVNNRDFKTLKVDMSTAQRLLPKIPKDKITVFESGISTHEEIVRYGQLANAFLIGSSLMAQENLDAATRALVFGRVKVCGLTNVDDANTAYLAGATYGGLIFAKGSPRYVSLEQATQVITNGALKYVGVFVNASVELVAEYCEQLSLNAVQLHGEEDIDYVSGLRKLLPCSCEIWKAVRVKDRIPQPSEFACDKIVLDTYVDGQRGGTGQSFDWSKLASVEKKDDYILGGGLAPENAKNANSLRLWGLDVNSGVESAPGKKSSELMQKFFGELR